MYTQVEKPKENKSRAVANSNAQKRSSGGQSFEFVDNRPEVIAQGKNKEVCTNGLRLKQATQLMAVTQTASDVIQREKTKLVAGITVTAQDNGAYPTWEMKDGKSWHIHWNATDKRGKQYHCVTSEANKKVHYFFTLDAGVITSRSSGQKGQKQFNNLPDDVQTFVTNNVSELLSW
jgi:hypothetical protein